MIFDRSRAALRANRPPQVVRDAVPRGERLLSWGFDTAHEPLVATDAGLWGYGERLAWVEIDHVSLAGDQLVITAVDGEDREVLLGEARDLAAVIRGQVEASVLHSRHVPLFADGSGVTVVARRTRDTVDWQLRYDPGVPGRGDVEARAAVALASIRDELGA
jgi:hypothetical protein